MKLKPRRMMHPSFCRTVDDEATAARLRQAGWVELSDARSLTSTAVRQRRFYLLARDNGHRRFSAYLSSVDFEAVMALKRADESNAQLLVRLARTLKLLGQADD